MKKKGIVLEIRGQYLIVMTSDGEFCRVPPVDGPLMEGDEIEFTHTVETSTAIRSKRQGWKHWTYIAAACLLLLITALPLWNMVFASAYAAVSIDINPSFELEVDEKYEVTDVQALNEDAERMLSDVEWKDRTMVEVTKNILSEARQHGFLKTNHDVLIVPVGLKDPSASQELLQIMKKEIPNLTAGSQDELTITMMESTKEIRKQAQDFGVSAGRYALYDSLKRIHKDVSEDKIRSLSISDVSSAIGGFKNIPNVVQYSNVPSALKKGQPVKPKQAIPVQAQTAAKPVKQGTAPQKKPELQKKQTAAVHTERRTDPPVKHAPKLTAQEQKDKWRNVPKLIVEETKYKAGVQAQKEKERTEEDKKYNSGYGQQQQAQQGGRVIKKEEKERNEKYKEEREQNKQNFVRPPLKKQEEKPQEGNQETPPGKKPEPSTDKATMAN